MYVIKTSFVRSRREWFEENLLTRKMSDILTVFEEVHVTLTVNGTDMNWRPHSSPHFDTMFKSPYTLQEWIAYCNDNNIALSMTSRPFNMDVLETISAYGALEVGFNVERSNVYIDPASDANRVGEDLRLSRPKTDYSRFVGNVLISLNGIIHPFASNDNGLYIRYGHNTLDGGPLVDINMINFERIGGFKIENIASSRMYRLGTRVGRYYDNCCFDLKYDISNKMIGAVIDGHLHFLDGVVEILGNSQIKIDWHKVPLLKRALLANGKPPGQSKVRNKELVSEADIRTNEWINDIVNSPFTYLVVFNRPDITKSVHEIASKGLPGVYQHPRPLKGPIFAEDGRTYSYKTFEDRSSYSNGKDNHVVISTPLKGHYPDAFDTRRGGITQYGARGTFAGTGFKMDVIKEVQFHVLPTEF